jgi:hypothetical protein
MDENDSCVEIKDGVMRICDHHHRLLTKVTRGINQLYVLNVAVTRVLRAPSLRGPEATRCQGDGTRHAEL